MSGLPITLGVSQTLERNSHLDDEAVVDPLTGSHVQRVPRRVAARGSSGSAAARSKATATGTTVSAAASAAAAPGPRVENRIALHAVSVDAENVRPLLVEERVEVHQERVVGDRAVPVGPVRTHDGRVGVMRVDTDVDVGAVVGDIHLCGLRGRRPIKRLTLKELGDDHRVLPREVVEPTVDRGS